MKKGFNLSDKIECGSINDIGFYWINISDFKEFIKELKEELEVDSKWSIHSVNKIIDKLAGEKLI